MESPEIIKGLFLILFVNVEDDFHMNKEPFVDTNKALIQSGKRDVEHRGIYYQEIQKLKEEMKTSQEELQSINEELQSTNEELTTSKEETQSLNEELQTVNTELQSKLVDFELGMDNMKNLLNSTGIAVLYVDNELNIKQFTESVKQIFKLRTSDIGRPYTDLATDLIYPEMKEDALHVVVDKNSIQKTIDTHDSRRYLIKIKPYQTGEITIDGLVITFTEITLI
jgi:two-component system CheB/CheR fusion protein